MSESTFQTFCRSLNNSGGSCFAAGEKLQQLREDAAVRGREWLQGAVADIRKDELREMATAAGLPGCQ